MGAGSKLELLTKVYETSMLPLQYPAYGSPGRSRTYDPMINSHLSPDCTAGEWWAELDLNQRRHKANKFTVCLL